MKSVKELLKRIAVRTSALVTALALIPCAFSCGIVYAEGEDQESGTENQNTSASQSIVIYRDGEKQPIEVKSGAEWTETGIDGGLEPTQKALTIEEFNSGTKVVPVSGNIYVLTVATGISPGTSVEYFAVRYTDENNNPQTKYIFPKIHSLPATFEYIKSLNIDYAAMNKRHQSLNDLGYKINEPSAPESLAAWSVDEYLFETEAVINKVDSIDVFMSKGKWTVQGMSVSKVTSIGGYGEYGYISGKYFLSIGKKYLARLKNKKSGAQTFNSPGDRVFNIGGVQSSYYTLEEVNSTEAVSEPFSEVYSFRLDIADEPDAGLESLLRNKATEKKLSDGLIAEDIAIDIEYKDKNGWTRNVVMPVLLSVITQGMMTAQDSQVATIGLAQQGDTLAFTACLPEFESFISYKVHTGTKARKAIKDSGGIQRKNRITDDEYRLEDALDKDYLQLVGASIYNGTCRISNTEDGVEKNTGKILKSYSYTFDFLEDAPFIYYATASPSGNKLSPSSSVSLTLSAYNTDDPLYAVNKSYDLLIRLRTDTIEGSGTTGNLRLRLKYIDMNGENKTSKFYNVKQEILNYLGYWPSRTEKQSHYGYYYGMSEGNYAEFPIQLTDVGSITSVELSLDNYSNDEWQTAGVYVGVVNSIGKRRIYNKSVTAGGVMSDYSIVRSLESSYMPPFPIEMQLLLTPGRSYRIDLGTGTVISSEDTIDFEKVRYSLSYEQTQLDFGYTKSVKTYDVVVKVADDPTANSINGDSGSQNHFFFQLRFKNGSSGYVLANQQLSADGFRAGCAETFSISINRDYNELTSVRIIPEDTGEKTNEFDKLNIEYITVTERAYGGTSMQYVVEDVGWIGIDYRDGAEGSSIVGNSGRSVFEISSTYSVSYKRDVVNLYCEVEALPWLVDDPDFDQKTSSKFKASLSADVEYVDYNGEPQTMSFDVVSRLYDYMNKTPVSFEAKSDGSDQALYDNMGTITDPEWMLRPNHRDRFIFPPLPNAKTIISITFRGMNRSSGQAQWVVGSLSLFSIINDSGVISLTSDKEYYRKMETSELCMMELDDSSTNFIQLLLPAGMTEEIRIPLSYNELPQLTSSGWTPAVTKYPDTTNDSVNIYVYPASVSRDIVTYTYDPNDSTKIIDVNDISVGAAVQYNLPFSKVMQIKQSPLKTYGSGTEDAVFYYLGLSANNMQSLKKLSLSCRDSTTLFDHAIIQQVRDNVIVNTYTLSLGKASGVLGLSAAPSKSTTVYDKKHQKMLLSFTTDTKETTLFGLSDGNTSIRDVAISFKYKSSLDKGSGSKRPEYYSPYVYLTEVGINSIGPGLMAEIPFEIPYVDEITGYRIVDYGDIDAKVDSAMIMNYGYEKKEKSLSGNYTYAGEELLDSYSFHDSYTLSNKLSNHNRVTKATSGTGSLNAVDLIFTTDVEKAGNLPSDTEVVMILNYKSGTASKSKLILDARKYIQSKDQQFVTYTDPDDTGQRKLVSSSARLRLFIPECDELQSVEIRLADETDIAKWNVKTLEGTTNNGEVELMKKNDLVFTSVRQEVNFEKVTLRTYVSSTENRQRLVTNHEASLVVEGDNEVIGVVRLGNNEKFGVTIKWLVDGIYTDVPSTYYYVTADGFRFVPPVNENSGPQNYVITVYSTKNTTVRDVITITVPVTENTDIYYPPQESSGQPDPYYYPDEPEYIEPSDEEPPDESSYEDESGYDESEDYEPEDEPEDSEPAESSHDSDESSEVESFAEGEQSIEASDGEDSGNETSDNNSQTDNEP